MRNVAGALVAGILLLLPFGSAVSELGPTPSVGAPGAVAGGVSDAVESLSSYLAAVPIPPSTQDLCLPSEPIWVSKCGDNMSGDLNMQGNSIILGGAALRAPGALEWNSLKVCLAEPATYVPLGCGTVSSVGAGAGLTGGPITTTGTLSIANGGVASAMLADGAVGTGKIADAAVTAAKVDSGQVQLRVSGTCASGSFMTQVDGTGTVTCSGYQAGTGLWKPSNNTLQVIPCSNGQVLKEFNGTWLCGDDLGTTYTGVSPIKVVGTAISLAPPFPCWANMALKWNGTAWVCDADANSGGTVTSITAGSGLTGGTITTSGTMAVDTASIQSRVTGSCAAGNYIRVVNQDGSVTCGVDQGNSYAAGTGLALSGTTFSIANGGVGTAQISTSASPTIAGLTVNGNVGIGTASPASLLTLQASPVSQGILLDTPNSNDSPNVIFREGGDPHTYNIDMNGGLLRFFNESAVGAADGNCCVHMVIDRRSGDVGIGTTSPAGRLQVVGGGGAVNPGDGATLDGADVLGDARLELRTTHGVPYVDFANDNTSDFTARVDVNYTGTNGLELETLGATPISLLVNSARALRIEPGSTANLVGGSSGNAVTAGVVGAVIGGGGVASSVNRVTDDFGVVGGGIGNTAGDN